MADEYSIPFTMGIVNYAELPALSKDLGIVFQYLQVFNLKSNYEQKGFPIELHVNMGVSFDTASYVNKYVMFTLFYFYDKYVIDKIIGLNIPVIVFVIDKVREQKPVMYQPTPVGINTYIKYLRFYYSELSYYQGYQQIFANLENGPFLLKATVERLKNVFSYNITSGKTKFDYTKDLLMAFNMLMIAIEQENVAYRTEIGITDDYEGILNKQLSKISNVQQTHKKIKRTRLVKRIHVDDPSLATDALNKMSTPLNPTVNNGLQVTGPKTMNDAAAAKLKDPLSIFIKKSCGYGKQDFVKYFNYVPETNSPFGEDRFYNSYVEAVNNTLLTALTEVNDILGYSKNKSCQKLIHVLDEKKNSHYNERLVNACMRYCGLNLQLSASRSVKVGSGLTKDQLDRLEDQVIYSMRNIANHILTPAQYNYFLESSQKRKL